MTTSLLDPAQLALLGRRHRVTLAEFHRMAEAGVFGPDPRVELLEGSLVEKSAKSPSHVLATDLLGTRLHHLLPPGYFVSMGNPAAIAERDSEPEPDAAVVRGAALVVEVARVPIRDILP